MDYKNPCTWSDDLKLYAMVTEKFEELKKEAKSDKDFYKKIYAEHLKLVSFLIKEGTYDRWVEFRDKLSFQIDLFNEQSEG
jgi:bifunctional pyridoxal-dependent enzyme with beta-cystathionase and maltose regulon repressor activities